MKKLFSMKLDVVDYSMHSDFEKISEKLSELPEKVKTAHIPSYEELERRPSKDFAIILYHPGLGTFPKYACYNSELTELNMALLVSKIEELPEELVKIAGANLTCAANHYKITIPEKLEPYKSNKFVDRDLNITSINETRFIEKISSAKSSKEEITKYALNGKYPIHTEGHLKKAMAWFDRNYTKLSVDEQREFIENVSSQAEELKTELEKTASSFNNLDYTKFNEDFHNHVNIRKSYLGDDGPEDAFEAYDDLVKRADEIGPEKVAYVLEILDRETGMDRLYGNGVLDPLRSCLAQQVKEASVEFEGRNINLTNLQNLDSDSLLPIVGIDAMTELKSDQGLEVFNSLPTPIKSKVVKLI